MSFAAVSSAGETAAPLVSECSGVLNVLTQSDGGTLVIASTGGCAPNQFGNWKNVALRLTVNGQMDSSYGSGGSVGIGSEVRDSVLASDGGLLIATGDAILKFTPAGLPDPDFGAGGSVPVAATQLSVSVDGSIAANESGEIQLLGPDGVPDPSFNGGAPLKPPVEMPGRPALEPVSSGPVNFTADGGLSGAYIFTPAVPDPYVSPTHMWVGVYKLMPNGQPDPAFGGGDGSVPVDGSQPQPNTVGPAWDLWNLTELDDGSINVTGYLTDNAGSLYKDPVPVSILASDAGSSTSFRPLSRLGQSVLDASDIVSSGAGKITIASTPGTYRGEPENPHENEFATSRFLRDGTGDPDFGDDGYTGLRLYGRAASKAVALTAGDGVTTAGSASTEPCGVDGFKCHRSIIVARYDQQGDLIRTFGDCGVASIPGVRWDRTSDPRQFHCSNLPLPKPVIDAAKRRGHHGNPALKIGIAPSTRNPAKSRPWEKAALTVPRPLRLRPGKFRTLGVYAGKAIAANRVRRKFLNYRRSTGTLFINNPAVRSWKRLKVEIPVKSIRKSGRGLRGRNVRLRVAYHADGAGTRFGFHRLRFRTRVS